MENKKPMKVSKEWYEFIEKFGVNRIKADVDSKMLPLCQLPNIIVKYFKLNNDRYLELISMEATNGNN